MSNIPYLEISARCPRRFFVPLQPSNGSGGAPSREDMAKLADYYSKIDNHQIQVYWKNGTWRKSSMVDFGGRIDKSLWSDSLRLLGKPIKNKKLRDDCLNSVDIAFAINGAESFGLYVTWNPMLIDDGNEVYPILVISDDIDSHKLPDSAKDRPVLLLSIQSISLSEDPKARKNPAGYNVLSKLFAGRSFWGYKLESSLAVIPLLPGQVESPLYTLCLDFGSSGSTASLIPSSVNDAQSSRDGYYIPSAMPWALSTTVPKLDNVNPDGKVVDCDLVNIGGDRIFKTFDPVPYHVSVGRAKSGERKATVPSMLYAINGVGAETLNNGEEDAIGFEAKNFHQDTRNPDYECFVYSPKIVIGNDEMPEIEAWHEKTGRGKDPAYHYLKAFFDQLYFSSSADFDSKKSEFLIDSVVCSHPVAWTEDKTSKFKGSLNEALVDSYISRRMYNDNVVDSLSNGLNFCMDEASAAFMGFTGKRYGGVQNIKNALIKLYQPFSPTLEDDSAPKTWVRELTPIRALVFDCGESTTDLVLLELIPGEDTHAMTSKVVHHFAIEQAGLELTRRVAKHIKGTISKYISDPNKIDDIVTKLRIPNDDRYRAKGNDPSDKEPLRVYRKRLIGKLYEVAERVKLAASNGESGAFSVKDFSQFTNIPGGMSGAVTKENLVTFVNDVFSSVFRQISLWMEDIEKLDVVLLSGRSSKLPGILEGIKAAIPVGKRPLNLDFVKPEDISLFVKNGVDDVAKSVVCEGLMRNCFNGRTQGGQKLVSLPISQKKRNRAIGILEMGQDLDSKGRFDTNWPLLFEADNALIDESNCRSVIEFPNPDFKGCFIGINFGGSGDMADRPRKFMKVLVDSDPGVVRDFDKLTMEFEQLSSTRITLRKVTVFRNGQEISREADEESSKVKLEVDCLRVSTYPEYELEDFRVTGYVHEKIDM